jgi:DNA-binding NarL/FixJ family response regulator
MSAAVDITTATNGEMPDVIAVDAGTLAGEVVRQVRRACPTKPIVAIGVMDSEEEIVSLAEAGTATLVMAEESREAIIAAVESAGTGRSPGPARIATILQKRLAELSARLNRKASAALTPRQAEILGLLAEGLNAKEIAQRLHVAPRTARNHIQNIYATLGVHRRSEAIAWLREQRGRQHEAA